MKPFKLVASPSDQMHANFSPDGRFIAYTSNESGRYEVYVETVAAVRPQVADLDQRWIRTTLASRQREIYYLSEDRQLMAVPVSSGAKPFGLPRRLFQTDVHPGVSLLRTRYVPSQDGTRFLVHTRSRDLGPSQSRWC